MAESMIERATAAVMRVVDENMEHLPDSVCADVARAAIEAMREPTEDMIPHDSVGRPHGPSILIWKEMIDAALKEQS